MLWYPGRPGVNSVTASTGLTQVMTLLADCFPSLVQDLEIEEMTVLIIAPPSPLLRQAGEFETYIGRAYISTKKIFPVSGGHICPPKRSFQSPGRLMVVLIEVRVIQWL
ncbi:hypothetical protein RRG08_057815 [Elysia crispata]|uniref:Uncharacterized protein n=1 Tax=Elysia crispata TaxID=231223 RepID=A0AAE1AZM3_9GAST|nr:hypothetical protein RRG08_057815 [Elysia crispata]